MKRKKVSKAHGETSRTEEAEAGQVEIQHSGSSITDLPSHILAAILFRLLIKEIAACKCVCKSLYAKISNPDFGQSEVLPIARTVDETNVSRKFYPLDFNQEGRSMKMFLYFAPGCPDQFEHYHVNMEFKTKLKIPVRNFPMVLSDTVEEITLNPKDHGYKVVNSCNGFICLSEPYRGKPVVVCNPYTGEFINLPQLTDVVGYEDYINCGFGYTTKKNQYKVVSIFELHSSLECDDTIGRLAQVHILGTSSWKNIESAACWGYTLTFPTYLNGSIHWFCHCEEKLSQMVSFDCEKECFLPFSLPPLKEPNKVNVGLGVLEGCLCICDSSCLTSIFVWVMKNDGPEKSWTQLFKIDMSRSDELLYGLYQPIEYLNDGGLLMFNYPRSVLIYYDPKKHALLLTELGPKDSKQEIVLHTPSFSSFKYVLAGCKVEILNVHSRCAGLKLTGEVPGRGRCLFEKTDYFDFLHDPHLDRVQSKYSSHETSKNEKKYEEYWWGKYEYCFSKIWRKP